MGKGLAKASTRWRSSAMRATVSGSWRRKFLKSWSFAGEDNGRERERAQLSIFSFLCFITAGPFLLNTLTEHTAYRTFGAFSCRVSSCDLNKKTKILRHMFLPGYTVICLPSHIRLTCLFLDIQGDLEALVHELNNLHKVSFFELSGGQGWSTWDREQHKPCSLK